jgi:hypothetical protein
LTASELKTIMPKVAEEDFKGEETEIKERLERYKSLVLKIAKAKKLDLAV